MLCLLVFATTGVLVRSGHAAAASPSAEDLLKLGHKTNFGYQEADVEVTVITGEPRVVCRGHVALSGAPSQVLPTMTTGSYDGGFYRWEIAPGAPAGWLHATVRCLVNEHPVVAQTSFEVRRGQPSTQPDREIIAFGTMITGTWTPPTASRGVCCGY